MPNASERGFTRRPVRFLHHDIVLMQFRPLDHQPEYTRRQSVLAQLERVAQGCRRGASLYRGRP